jgi:DNA modification methylase
MDPFMGSGSTALAAIRNDRCAIGFEINPSYAKIAAERLENFFDDKAAKLAQRELSLGI